MTPPPRGRSPVSREPFAFGGQSVRAGQRAQIELPVARLATQTRIGLPVAVLHGARPGPVLWLSAAIHGDELNGLEIIDRILARVEPRRLAGTLLAVPVVNVFGFIQQQRYLPDGRDLNRSFPGSQRGSLASRLARLFLDEVVGPCDVGIDLHTAGGHRVNLPQVRADLTDERSRAMAEAFTAPIMIHGEAPRGSLREAVARLDKPILVYEAGEPHRFNTEAIDLGVKGVLSVMRHLQMLRGGPRRNVTTVEATQRTWIRARTSGLLRLRVALGRWVSADEPIGVISDTFGNERREVLAPSAGLVIGQTNHPMVHTGDAIVHLATDVQTAGPR